MSGECEFNGDRLLRQAAGRLDPEERAGLDAHLVDCDTCRSELSVLTALRAAAPGPPAGLEARIRAAVRAELRREAPAGAVTADARRPRVQPVPRGRRRSWRVAWALPLAAAAALALVWVGVRAPWTDAGGPTVEVTLADDYAPYGTWPASDGLVAGEPVLSDLSVEELERLLEEMR